MPVRRKNTSCFENTTTRLVVVHQPRWATLRAPWLENDRLNSLLGKAGIVSLQAALDQIKFARDYTLSLLADIDDAEWFVMPAGVPTHIAWQVGHIAMAEYGLALFRQRGRQPLDLEMMPSPFRKAFSRGSTPTVESEKHPSPAEIRATLSRIHEQVLLEAPQFSAEQLNEPTEMPYAGPATKLGALLFCPLHEMIHAGQIGVLRRLLGKAPVR